MWRMRRSVRKKLFVCGLCIVGQLVLFLVGQTVVYRVAAGKYEAVLAEKEAKLAMAGRTVYITKREVKTGELLTEENTEKRYLLSEQNPQALPLEVFGMKACADLEEGVIINTSLCCMPEVITSERMCVFDYIRFAECFSAYDVVDVRLRYANGENYCVLKKKQLQKEDKESLCAFYLTESEQLLMSSARYDVECYDGAELYLVAFREARLQEDAVSEYLPSVQVVAQLQNGCDEYKGNYQGWCRKRLELEQRLAEYYKLRLAGLI